MHSLGNFYPYWATLSDGSPTISVITAVFAILLLGISIKNAINASAIRAAHPIEYLFFLMHNHARCGW